MRVEGDDGELRPWHYIYVYSESRLIMRVRYDSHIRTPFSCDWLFRKPNGQDVATKAARKPQPVGVSHMRLIHRPFKMLVLGVLYGVGPVSARKAGGHVAKHMKLAAHCLTCTAPRGLTRVVEAPRVV